MTGIPDETTDGFIPDDALQALLDMGDQLTASLRENPKGTHTTDDEWACLLTLSASTVHLIRNLREARAGLPALLERVEAAEAQVADHVAMRAKAEADLAGERRRRDSIAAKVARLGAEMPRIERNLSTLIDGAAASFCVVCKHVKHNELAYCQVGQCACSTGTSVATTAAIIRRDLRGALGEAER